MDSNITLCVGTSFRAINDFECIISRIAGSIIVFISLLSTLFNIRFLYWSFMHRQNQSHPNLIILSMIFSSLLVIITITPSVILQCLTCTRLCSSFYCQSEGFISYLNGCVHMFMLMMISVIRYDIVLNATKTKHYFQQHSSIVIFICWLFALIFALPPLFNWNKYTPEGLGFHCGLDWHDRSINSRLYFSLTFSFVYFIPLIVLSIVNIRVYYVIHRLLHRVSTTNQRSLAILSSAGSLSIEKGQSPPLIPLNNEETTNSDKFVSKSMTVNNRLRVRYIADPVQMRLKADRRFALATIFLVSEYLLSWTPYACVALLYLFDIKFLIEQPLLITICAFIAKISMIINPFIYISTIKTKQFKTILLWKKCSCHICRMN